MHIFQQLLARSSGMVVAGCSSIGVYLSTQAAHSSVPNRRPCICLFFSTNFSQPVRLTYFGRSKHAYLSTTTYWHEQAAQAVVAGCSSIGVYLSTQAVYSTATVPNRRPCMFIFFHKFFPACTCYLFWSTYILICLIDSQTNLKKNWSVICMLLRKKPANNNDGPVCLIRSLRL